ncbi:MAG: hypothetical protein KDN05_24060, partial [Verrucomicrobiae bacterium]|nr:hypothetical protein [Verrucomicrobiae bacterium]
AEGAVGSAAIADGSIASRDLELGATGLVRKPVLLAEVGGEEGDPVFAPMSLQLDPSGSLDPSFGTGGFFTGNAGGDDLFAATCVQDDGTILVAGRKTDYAAGNFLVGRLLENGTPDPSFDGDGFQSFAGGSASDLEFIRDMVALENGQILAGGVSEGRQFILAKLNADGSLDTTFGTNGVIFPRSGNGWFDQTGPDEPNTFDDIKTGIHSILVQSDGKLVLVGCSVDMTYPEYEWGPYGFAVVRCHPDGTTDVRSLARYVDDDSTSSIAVGGVLQANGKIVVAGYGPGSGTNDFLMLRFTSNLAADPTFGTNGWVVTDMGGGDIAADVKLDSAGRIVMAGSSGGDVALARFDANGVLDPTFGSGGKSVVDVGAAVTVRALAFDSQGRMVVVGSQGGDFV